MELLALVKALTPTNGEFKKQNAYKGMDLEFNRFSNGSQFLFLKRGEKFVFCFGYTPEIRLHLNTYEKDQTLIKLWNFFAGLYSTNGIDMSKRGNIRRNGRVIKKTYPSKNEFVYEGNYCFERSGRL